MVDNTWYLNESYSKPLSWSTRGRSAAIEYSGFDGFSSISNNLNKKIIVRKIK